MSNPVKHTDLPVYFPLLPQKSMTGIPRPSQPSRVTPWWHSPGRSAKCDGFVPSWLNPQSLGRNSDFSWRKSFGYSDCLVWSSDHRGLHCTWTGMILIVLHQVGSHPLSCNSLCWWTSGGEPLATLCYTQENKSRSIFSTLHVKDENYSILVSLSCVDHNILIHS